METQHHNIMEYRARYTIKRTAFLLHFNKFIAQQLDHYLYSSMTKIMRNVQKNSQKQRKQKRNN